MMIISAAEYSVIPAKYNHARTFPCAGDACALTQASQAAGYFCEAPIRQSLMHDIRAP